MGKPFLFFILVELTVGFAIVEKYKFFGGMIEKVDPLIRLNSSLL
jgi:hypothetical protein